MIQERVRAGLKQAVEEGKQLGRPPLAPELEQAHSRRFAGAREHQEDRCAAWRLDQHGSESQPRPFRGKRRRVKPKVGAAMSTGSHGAKISEIR